MYWHCALAESRFQVEWRLAVRPSCAVRNILAAALSWGQTFDIDIRLLLALLLACCNG